MYYVPLLGVNELIKNINYYLQCRSEISEQRRRKMDARDTRIRVFLTRLKLRIVYAFVPLLFITIILLFLYCLRRQKNKLCDCRQVENLHTVCGFDHCQFRSANAADESIHWALFRSLNMQQRSREMSKIKSPNYDSKNRRHDFFQCLP